jgi:hypothetical protein
MGNPETEKRDSDLEKNVFESSLLDRILKTIPLLITPSHSYPVRVPRHALEVKDKILFVLGRYGPQTLVGLRVRLAETAENVREALCDLLSDDSIVEAETKKSLSEEEIGPEGINLHCNMLFSRKTQ